MKNVAVGIVENEYTYLFLQREDGSWTFPSGKQEEGESLEEAALREIFEETGQNAVIESYLGNREISQEFRLHYFKCSLPEVKSIEIEKDKFIAWAWMSPAGIMHLSGDRIFSATKDILTAEWNRHTSQDQRIHAFLDGVVINSDPEFLDAQVSHCLRKVSAVQPEGI